VAPSFYSGGKYTLENTEGAIEKGQSRITDNIGFTRRGKPQQKHTKQTNTNNVNKTRATLQTTGGKDEPNIVSHE